MEEMATREKVVGAFADFANGAAMSEIVQLPAECARANVELMQHRFKAYSELAQRCAQCDKPEEILDEYAQFGQRMFADYSDYAHGVAEVFGRSMAGGRRG